MKTDAPSTANARPLPVPTRETLPFWESAARGKLSLPRCERCAEFLYPPPPRCPRCLSDQLIWIVLSGRGRLHSWTTIYADLSSGIKAPFTIGEVELDEQAGLVIVGLIVGIALDQVKSGARVKVTFAQSRMPNIAYPQFELSTGA
jgi:uncharacterized OB-fold protein